MVPAFPQKLQKGFAPLPAGSPLAQNEERLVREFDNNTVMLETNFELLLTVLCTIEMEFRLLIKGNIGVIAFSLWPMFYSIASMAAAQQNQPDVPRFLADQSGQQSAAINHEGTGKADEYQINVGAQRDRMNQQAEPE